MEAQQKKITVSDGSAIYYEILGQGEPLFLLHGNFGSSTFFNKQVPDFLKKYQLFLVDSRGHGKSSNQSSKLDFFQMANDLKEICIYEKLQRINILGYSDGANVAMVFASRYGHFVKKMILNAGNVCFKGLTPFTRLKSQLGLLSCQVLGKVIKPLKKFIPYLKLIVHDIGIRYEDLQNIWVPTLVLAGAKDIVLAEESKKIAMALPLSELKIVPKMHHRFARQAPSLFNEICLNFLNEKEL